MGIGQSSFIPKDVSVQGATDCKITVFNVIDANTEYSLALQANLKKIRIRCRESAEIKYTFTELESGTDSFTIFRGTVDEIDNLSFTGKTIYFQSNKNSVTIEIAEFF
jgi:hypothetical protein